MSNSEILLSVDIEVLHQNVKGYQIDNEVSFFFNLETPPVEPNTIYAFGVPPPKNSAARPYSIKVETNTNIRLDILCSSEQLAITSIENPVNFQVGSDSSAGGETANIYTQGVDEAVLGLANIKNAVNFLEPKGVFDGFTEIPNVKNQVAFIRPFGYIALSINKHFVRNVNRKLLVSSISPALVSRPTIYNLRKYQPLKGFDSQSFSKPFVQGGVKYLKTKGYEATTIPKPIVVNTMADQYAKPKGIAAPAVERPIVRPYIAHPKGIYSQAFGVQHRIGFIPTLKPDGLSHTKWGNTTIWDHTRPLNVTGFNSFDSGYAKIFDPMRRLHVPSLITSAIFGDTAIRNTSKFISAVAVNDGSFSDYSTLENSNRYCRPSGVDSLTFGTTNVRNKTPSIFVGSIDAPAFNTPAIGYRQRTVKPAGFDRLVLGKPVVIKTPELAPKGLLAYQSGQTTIWYKNRTIKLDGFDRAEYGEKHTVWLRVRLLTPLSWVSNLNGRAVLTRNVRDLIAKGYDSSGYGRSWASFSPRSIAPASIFKEYPTKHLVGRLQTVAPVGYIATLFGTRIIPVAQTLYPLGFAERFGVPIIDWYTRQLFTKGFFTGAEYQALRWGYTHVYNSVQYIKQEPDLTGGLAPPKWSDWQSIENRNKRIGVIGFQSQRFGYTYIDNNAEPLLPMGIKPPIIGGGMVAGAIRYLSTFGVDAPYFGSYSSIYNDARVVVHSGGTHSTYGRPLVESNRRYFRGIGRFESLEISEPMISHAIRTLRFDERYSIAPPQINLPTIDTYNKYIEPAGFEPNRYGTPHTFIHFNIIAPKWRQLTLYGEGRVYNLTPEMRTYGHDSMEFGAAAIRTQWRKVATMGDTATLFGKLYISDRTKTIRLQGWLDTKLSQKHVVINTGAPLFSEQRVNLDGRGIKVPDVNPRYLQVPEPALNQNVLYVRQSEVSTLFGATVVTANTIIVETGIGIINFGNDNRIELKHRAITFGEANQVIQSTIALGKPRMSPHTIYAPAEAPSQAKDNHPESNHSGRTPHVIDFWVSKGVGKAKVENKNRAIITKGLDSSLTGRPYTYLKAIVINLDKKGIPAGRAGLPKIPFTRQDIYFREQSVDTLSIGKPNLLLVWSTVSSAGGISAPVIERPTIQLKHRWVIPKGLSSEAMGKSLSNDKPYMWQGLRVGAHVPTSIGAGVLSSYGTAFISLRVRGIAIEGIDSFISEYDLNNFDKRMTVTRPRLPPKPSIRITADGFNAYQSGSADIQNKQRFITPDGNSDQFRKGGYHA